MEKVTNKSKHFTTFEKKLFLDILTRYKHVIEIKKSDSNTLKNKDTAWSAICKEYNASHLISQERNMQQLKKLWTNLKQTQRDILTKEKQIVMATGGGPSIKSLEVDPDVLAIAPHLMTTAPVIYSSNLGNEELQKRETEIINYIGSNESQYIETVFSEDFQIMDSEDKNNKKLCNANANDILNKENVRPDTPNKEELPGTSPQLKIISLDTTQDAKHILTEDSKRLWQSGEDLPLKRRKRNIIDDYEHEATWKQERKQKLLEQEMQINKMKIEHEKKLSALKETHLIKLQEQELRAATATAETAELKLKLQAKQNKKFFNE